MAEVAQSTDPIDHTQLGDKWDPIASKLYGPEVRDAVVAAAGLDDLPSGSLVVEIGAGTGFLTDALVKHRKNFQVTAVEPNAGARASLQEKLGHWPNLTILPGTFEDNSVASGSAACVLGTMTLHHAVDLDLAMEETARMLSPGGRAAFADIKDHEYGNFVTGHYDPRPGTNMDDLKRSLEAAGLLLVDGPRLIGVDCTEKAKVETDTDISVPVFLVVGKKALQAA